MPTFTAEFGPPHQNFRFLAGISARRYFNSVDFQRHPNHRDEAGSLTHMNLTIQEWFHWRSFCEKENGTTYSQSSDYFLGVMGGAARTEMRPPANLTLKAAGNPGCGVTSSLSIRRWAPQTAPPLLVGHGAFPTSILEQALLKQRVFSKMRTLNKEAAILPRIGKLSIEYGLCWLMINSRSCKL